MPPEENPAIEVMCRLFGLDREQVLAQIKDREQEIERVRRITSQTPLEGECR